MKVYKRPPPPSPPTATDGRPESGTIPARAVCAARMAALVSRSMLAV